MNILDEIENAKKQLRKWFEKFDTYLWDKKLEKDIFSGKLSHLANQAILDYKAGKCKNL
ncbi:hypothetical protein QUF70_05060 [Desulfobacterales bacterium HSG17]|nr:hypothetical protein [Desulfobacterales bacterium HSG17]